MSRIDPVWATVAELSRAFGERTLSPVDAVSALLERIRRRDSKLHAYIAVYEAEARMAAEAHTNQLCWEAHPKPAGEPEPWLPADCGVYRPADAAADLDAATWAADHPGSNARAGWAP